MYLDDTVYVYTMCFCWTKSKLKTDSSTTLEKWTKNPIRDRIKLFPYDEAFVNVESFHIFHFIISFFNFIILFFKCLVLGCPEFKAPLMSWVAQNGDSVLVKCNLTRQIYEMRCVGNKWEGHIENCSLGENFFIFYLLLLLFYHFIYMYIVIIIWLSRWELIPFNILCIIILFNICQFYCMLILNSHT